MELQHSAKKNTISKSLLNHSLFAGVSTGYVIKQLVHAFSCAYIELWMHLGGLERTQEAPGATHEVLSCSPNFSRASISRCTHAKP